MSEKKLKKSRFLLQCTLRSPWYWNKLVHTYNQLPMVLLKTQWADPLGNHFSIFIQLLQVWFIEGKCLLWKVQPGTIVLDQIYHQSLLRDFPTEFPFKSGHCESKLHTFIQVGGSSDPLCPPSDSLSVVWNQLNFFFFSVETRSSEGRKSVGFNTESIMHEISMIQPFG